MINPKTQENFRSAGLHVLILGKPTTHMVQGFLLSQNTILTPIATLIALKKQPLGSYLPY